VIVRWGLREVGPLLEELGSSRPLLVTSARLADLDVPVVERFTGVRRHVPRESVEAATAAAAGADLLVGAGGGSAMDTSKAVSAATGLPLVTIPTTYSGAEWTSGFGVLEESARRKVGGSGTNTVAIVYEPEMTLDLPVSETVGTALNALAHCAEALYGGDCEDAVVGARLIGRFLPAVVADGRDLEARTRLLEGAVHAGRALAERGLYLGHALAQALGGRYGLPHGAMNALCLPPALRFNRVVVPEAVAMLGQAFETDDAIARVEELAALGDFGRLRDNGVPEDDLGALAEAAVERPGARANPRPVTAAEAEELYRSIW
jgi:alcohol dehydrogenase class IV